MYISSIVSGKTFLENIQYFTTKEDVIIDHESLSFLTSYLKNGLDKLFYAIFTDIVVTWETYDLNHITQAKDYRHYDKHVFLKTYLSTLWEAPIQYWYDLQNTPPLAEDEVIKRTSYILKIFFESVKLFNLSSSENIYKVVYDKDTESYKIEFINKDISKSVYATPIETETPLIHLLRSLSRYSDTVNKTDCALKSILSVSFK